MDLALIGLVLGPQVVMKAPMPQLALLHHFGMWLVVLSWCSFPYWRTPDLSFCAPVPDVDRVDLVVE